MKKLCAYMACVALIVSACGSTSSQTHQTSIITDSDGNTVQSNDMGDSYFIDQLPYNKVDYNGSYFSVTDISFYQAYDDDDYSYHLYVTIECDTNSLTDSERHWLLSGDNMLDTVFQTSVNIKSEKNGLDSEDLSRALYWSDETHIKQMYYLRNPQKYDFSDADPRITVDVLQDDTYETTGSNGDSHTFHKRKTYYWTFDDGIQLKDASEMPQEYVDGFVEYAKRFTGN